MNSGSFQLISCEYEDSRSSYSSSSTKHCKYQKREDVINDGNPIRLNQGHRIAKPKHKHQHQRQVILQFPRNRQRRNPHVQPGEQEFAWWRIALFNSSLSSLTFDFRSVVRIKAGSATRASPTRFARACGTRCQDDGTLARPLVAVLKLPMNFGVAQRINA